MFQARHESQAVIPRVLVCQNLSAGFSRQVAEGVSRYSHQHGPWDVVVIDDLFHPIKELTAYPDAAGIIAMAPTVESRRVLEQPGVPIVLTQDLDNGGLPRVGPNDPLVGRMALESFRAKGFKRAAYCGSVMGTSSLMRRDAFLQAAEHCGMDCFAFEENVFEGMERYPDMTEHLRQWLTELPKPIGLLVFCDSIAMTVLHFCRSLHIHVPEEIAVLGVDNDALLCNFTSPRLSSIDHGAHRIGYEAAELLDELMRGGSPPDQPVLVDPVGVVERQTTDTMAVDHPDLVAALTFIRRNAMDGIHVRDVLEEVPLSRRMLELGFKRTLGRTVHQEILRVRIEAAEHLLTNTNMMLPDIAQHCGFGGDSQFSRVFKRLTGVSPSQFRRKFQVGTGEQE